MATRHPEPSFAISFTSFPLFIMIRPSSLGCQLWAASCSLASQWPPSMNTNLRRHLFVLWSILLARSWLILLCSFFSYILVSLPSCIQGWRLFYCALFWLHFDFWCFVDEKCGKMGASVWTIASTKDRLVMHITPFLPLLLVDYCSLSYYHPRAGTLFTIFCCSQPHRSIESAPHGSQVSQKILLFTLIKHFSLWDNLRSSKDRSSPLMKMHSQPNGKLLMKFDFYLPFERTTPMAWNIDRFIKYSTSAVKYANCNSITSYGRWHFNYTLKKNSIWVKGSSKNDVTRRMFHHRKNLNPLLSVFSSNWFYFIWFNQTHLHRF